MVSRRARAIGPIGTMGRVALGGGLVALAFAVTGVQWWEALLGFVGFPAILMLGQLLRLRSSPTPIRATDHVGFCVNAAVLGALLISSSTRDAAMLWLGASMLLAAWRGYAGCESLAISNWLLRRDDQVGCMVFAPIDQIEARARDGRRKDPTPSNPEAPPRYREERLTR